LENTYSENDATPPAVVVDNLTYRYPNGHLALKGVSLEITQGRTTAVIGKNGTGKTTLAKHLNSLLKPTSGSVTVMGIDASKRTTSEMAGSVGYVFQNPEDQLFEASVFEEVAFGPRNLGMTKAQIKQSVNEALSLVDLLPHVSTHPYNLTYGQRKMLCIASVLAMEPQIVVLDEPNAGQDFSGLNRLGKILEELNRKNKTVIIISHDIEFVASHTNEAIVMHDGRVTANDATRVVLSNSSVLATSALRPPQVTRLAIKLSKHGIKNDAMTPEELVEDISRIVAGRGP
jgi:energy-coupling factor transporter ATP-binding protein EcfA2